MKYYLTRGTIGATDLEIGENDYEDYKESNKVLTSCLSFEKSYEILLSNYIDLENERLSWATLEMVMVASRDDFLNATLSLDRRMVNFLSTARLHIEHLQKRGRDCVSGQSIEDVKAVIKCFCNTEKSNRPEYKFMWDLRNEVLHSSLPTRWLSFSSNRTNPFDDSDPKFEHSLNFGMLKSLATGFKPEELEAISSNDQIDLMSVTRVYMESLSTIHVKFREYIAESVSQARSRMEEAFHRYKKVCEDSLTGLYLWKVNDSLDIVEKPYLVEKSHFSLFLDDRRIQLQKKNRKLVNLRNSHVTGKQAE